MLVVKVLFLMHKDTTHLLNFDRPEVGFKACLKQAVSLLDRIDFFNDLFSNCENAVVLEGITAP